MFLIEKTVWVW